MMLNKSDPDIALVRFSALGDVTLVAPVIHSLRRHFPDATLTWITSPPAYSLLQGLPGVHFEVFDKPRSLADYWAFYRAFRRRSFDVVLAMQASLRINLLYPALHAPIKIGFDRTRAREGQWLFCNRAIPFADTHLLDSFMAFAAMLGAPTSPVSWNLPIGSSETGWALKQLKSLPRPLVAIHPCASKKERTWSLDYYATVMQNISRKWHAGLVITGGPAPDEQDFCARLASRAPAGTLNLCGHTSPKQLAAVLGEADVLLAPDTGAVHLATAMQTPVVGLYAVAPPGLSGPYKQQQYSVDCYPQAVQEFLGKDAQTVPWNTRVHHPQAMSLIQPDAVMEHLERALSDTRHG